MKVSYFARVGCDFDDCTTKPLELEIPLEGGKFEWENLLMLLLNACVEQGWRLAPGGGVACRFHANLKSKEVQ